MLKVTVRNRGEIAVFRCMGRMVAGEDARALWDGVRHAAGKRLVVLDLAEVDAIDAGGLGLLVFLHTSASSGGMELKLINPTQRTRKLLVLTNLDSVLEICSPQDVEWWPSGAEHAHAAEVEPNLYSNSIGTCRLFRQDDGLLGSDPLG
jgi:anti-anti-sigma factor